MLYFSRVFACYIKTKSAGSDIVSAKVKQIFVCTLLKICIVAASSQIQSLTDVLGLHDYLDT